MNERQQVSILSEMVMFKSFYKQKLMGKLEEQIDNYAASLGVNVKSTKVMELKNRWGSCTTQGAINLHWKCTMLSLSVLDYVIVHELAHIKDTNHTPNFWRMVEKVLSVYHEQINWLKFNGAGVSL